MSESIQRANTSGEFSQAELIRLALDGTLKAIAGYDDILWKVRAGYAAVLYGVLFLALSKEVASLPMMNPWTALYATVLVIGFSIAACVIDAGFLIKKLKVVVMRDALVRLSLAEPHAIGSQEIEKLCRITGEMPVDELPDRVKQEFWPKMWSNIRWTLLPLYITAPLAAAISCAAVWATR